MSKYANLMRIGRVKMPTSTTCARCGMVYVSLAIKEQDGTINAYCAACAARIDDEKPTAQRLTRKDCETMGIIEAIKIMMDVATSGWYADEEQRPAMEMVANLIDAYDALAPDWTQAPGWAQWYAIDPNEEGWWYSEQPIFERGVWDVVSDTDTVEPDNRKHDMGDLLDVLSPRLCIWQRPEAQP